MKTLSCAALLLALVLPAFAEMAGHGPEAGEGRTGMGMMHGMCPMMGMRQRTEGALAFLKTEFKITGAQTGTWDMFAAALREAIEARGASLVYLPKHSPDLNPIEMAFSNLKSQLRKPATRTVRSLHRGIGKYTPTLRPRECANYFRHAGYGSN